MACCLMAPSHFLNQCWLLISKVLWHLPENNFTMSTLATILYYEFENHTFKITSISPRDHWVNSLWPSDIIWRKGSRSTLAQVMACCLTTPSHYLNQCWLIIIKVHCLMFIWGQFRLRYHSHWSLKLAWKLFSKILFKSPRGHWVNIVLCKTVL